MIKLCKDHTLIWPMGVGGGPTYYPINPTASHVCLRLSTFARICLRFRLCVCLRLSTFVCVCLRLFAFARICLRPLLLRPPLRDTDSLASALNRKIRV